MRKPCGFAFNLLRKLIKNTKLTIIHISIKPLYSKPRPVNLKTQKRIKLYNPQVNT